MPHLDLIESFEPMFFDFLLDFIGGAADDDIIQRETTYTSRVYSVSTARLIISSTRRTESLLSIRETETWSVWAFGEAYARPGGMASITREVGQPSFRPSSLNGHFLLLAYEKARKIWHVWTNRFGTLHAYYATDGYRAVLGTFFPAVAALASKRQLDWVGLTGFFGLGFFPQDRTYYDDVRILRPATHYEFDEHGSLVCAARYWDWWHEPDRSRSYRDTVAEFGHIFQDVVRSQTQHGRVALPISGGLDSRATVAALPERVSAAMTAIWPYSYGYTDNSVETRIAGRIARARGLPLHRFTIQPYLFDRLEHVLGAVEGFQDITQSRQAFIVQVLAEEAEYVVAAHWGDVWLDDMGFAGEEGPEHEETPLQQALHKVAKRSRHWLIEHVCKPQLKEDPEDVLRALVGDEMNRVAHIEDVDFRVKAFKTDQWSFRWTLASLRMFQPGVFPRLVFYDTRLADFFCTVPSRFVEGRRLQIDYLKYFAPDLARITWEARDSNLYRHHHFHTWQVPKRAAKKVWRMLTRQQPVQRNWEVQFLNERGRRGLIQWLQRPGLLLHEFVAPDTVRTLLDTFYEAPTGGNGYTVSMLLTLSVWLEFHGSACR